MPTLAARRLPDLEARFDIVQTEGSMQLVQCSGAEPFVLDDEVADALMDYAFELATYHRHDLVRLPARDAMNTRITVALLLGPASELQARTTTMFDLVGEELVGAELRRRTNRMRAIPGVDAEDAAFE